MKPRIKPKLQANYRITPLKGDTRVTLVGDEFFMAHDRLMLLIYNAKLAE